jgi:3-deoxy-D-manno-octulosonic-acid transferase
MMRVLYTIAGIALLPIALLRVWWRGLAEPGYRVAWRERLGHASTVMRGRHAASPLIWVHAVSLGETHAAKPLIEGLLHNLPHHRVLITSTTATGRAAAADIAHAWQGRVTQAWLPYDLPWAVRRFLKAYEPVLGIVMETEVWPNLMHAAKAQGVMMMLANARMSERSARGYLRAGGLMRNAFAEFDAVLAQSVADAGRLSALGARNARVTGNLKFDMRPSQRQIAQGRQWRQRIARPVVLAASTRDGEEAIILDSWQRHAPQWKSLGYPLLVMVPRHPQRFDEVGGLIAASGLTLTRRSALPRDPADTPISTDALLGNSMAEMAMYYAQCDVVIMGGSLGDYGSQNFIEACACGKPVVLGPSTFNFAAAAASATASGAAISVSASREAVSCALRLLSSPQSLAQAAQSAERFATQHRGALRLHLEAVLLLLDQRQQAQSPLTSWREDPLTRH